jgi:hypothetical protein
MPLSCQTGWLPGAMIAVVPAAIRGAVAGKAG